MKTCTLGLSTPNHFKICEIYYGNSPSRTNLNRGAWSYKPVTFHDNAGKKLRSYDSTESYKQAILGLANLRIEDTIGSRAKEKSQERHDANNLYIRKLVRIVHFLPEIIYLSRAFIKNS